MRLSKNFVLSEMTRSNTARRKGISNEPEKEHLANLQTLVTELIQPMRDAIGPIRVTSGYRSPKLNRAIGGSSRSQHCKGQAIDIDDTFGHKTNAEMYHYIKDNLDFDQMVWEFGTEYPDGNPNWVHISWVSHRPNRKQEVIAIKKNGKTKYVKDIEEYLNNK